MAGTLQTRLGFDELTGASGAAIWKALLAEFIGNLILNLFGCGACVNSSYDGPTSDLVLISLAFGLAVFAAVSAIGHVSGGHLNPAVTAGLVATGHVRLTRALLYVVAQCAGAAAGSALLKSLMAAKMTVPAGLTTVSTDLTSLQGFGIEFFLGFILVFVVCGVCDPNKADAKSTAPLTIGLTVTLGHLLAVSHTGAAMNPARAFGAAVVANSWVNHWVYWLGPILGGIGGSLLYRHGFAAPQVEQPTYKSVATDDKELKRLDSGKADELA